MKALACGRPRQLRQPLSRLQVPDIRAEAIRQGLVAEISATTIWRWLAEDALRPWAHRSWIFPRDPDFARKAGVVLDLSRAARLEALADGPEIDPGSAPGVRVPMRVHRRCGAVDAELLVRVRREVTDRVDRDPELERDQLLRHASREALERGALAGGQRPRVGLWRSPHERGPSRRRWRRALAGPVGPFPGRLASFRCLSGGISGRFSGHSGRPSRVPRTPAGLGCSVRCHFGTFAGVCVGRERAPRARPQERSTPPPPPAFARADHRSAPGATLPRLGV